MTIAPGRRLGPYEVVSSLGAGGMGEVYRARDTRLGREVALKVLPPERSNDPDRRRRFESEARAVAALDNPHVLALHDLGSEDGVSYVVFELVEGRTLRQRLEGGALPVRKCVEWGVQICRGLAAAHARGIVHRDLKPSNIGITADGRIKILDFGLSKVNAPTYLEGLSSATSTESGFVVGTVGYMAPEQVRGQAADARSDIFSLGAVLYEMLTGRRAFHAATPADTILAILHHDAPETSSGSASVPPGLDRVVRRCLEKDPDDRFQTARDLAFALENQLGVSSSGIPPAAAPRSRVAWPMAAAGLLVVWGLVAGAFVWGSRRAPRLLDFKQLTFRRGMILNARFTPDGNTVVYSALLDGNPAEIYARRLDRPETQRLDLPTASLIGVSSSGELALRTGRPGEKRYNWKGTLARVPLAGGAPRQVIDDAWYADWAPNGQDLAVVREVEGLLQLEYPIGRVLVRPLEISDAGFGMRVSPRGDRVAFTTGVGAENVKVVARTGEVKGLKAEAVTGGLAWDPSGDAVWVGAGKSVQSMGLWRLGMDGTAREVARLPGVVMVHDVSRDGRLLVHHGFERMGVRARGPDETSERDLCPLSFCQDIQFSADGRRLLLRDVSLAFEPGSANRLFLRPIDGGPPVHLGEGSPLALSPDGGWALVSRGSPGKPVLELIPTGAGGATPLSTEGLDTLGIGWFPDRDRVLVVGRGLDGSWRTYLIDLPSGKPRPVMPDAVVAIPGPVMGGSVLGFGWFDGSLAWYPLAGGEPRPLTVRRPPGTHALRVSEDGRYLFLGEDGVPGRIDRVELSTGRRLPWKTLLPDDPAGVVGTFGARVAPDGRAYGYVYLRLFQDLYLVEGVR